MSDDYLVQLRETAADPYDAVIMSCRLCPYRVAFRVWSDRDADALDAFLDGLAELSGRLGVPTYGFWLLDPDPADARPKQSQRCQLWRAPDRTLVTESTFINATLALDEHLCPGRN